MRTVAAVLFSLASSAAFAGPKCTDAPADQWMKVDEMRAKIVASNYKIDVFKTTKENCYEIYGRNKEGARVEVYFDPVSGRVVKETSVR